MSYEPSNGESQGGVTELNEATVESTAGAAPEDTEVVADPVAKPQSVGPDNWWAPENWKDDNLRKSVQTEFQKHAERAKELDRKYQDLERQQQQFINEARSVVQDPERYRQLRRQAGFTDETAPGIKEPKAPSLRDVRTLEDLDRVFQSRDEHWRQVLTNEKAQLKAELEARIGSVAEPVARQKWESALGRTKEKYGSEFAAKEVDVVTKIVNGPYRALYGQLTEEQLLEKVFLAEFPEEAQKARMATAAATKSAKATTASTSKPSRKGGTALPKGGSKDDIIARIQERYGPPK